MAVMRQAKIDQNIEIDFSSFQLAVNDKNTFTVIKKVE